MLFATVNTMRTEWIIGEERTHDEKDERKEKITYNVKMMFPFVIQAIFIIYLIRYCKIAEGVCESFQIDICRDLSANLSIKLLIRFNILIIRLPFSVVKSEKSPL